MIRTLVAGKGVIGLAVMGAACAQIAFAAAPTKPVKPAKFEKPVVDRCLDPVVDNEQVAYLVDAVRKAVAALPADRASAEDVEATILFTISQRDYSPAVVRAALNGLSGGKGVVRIAVSRVRTATLSGCGIGTAGLRNGGFAGNGTSFFTGPIVGVGGGSAGYSQQ